MHDLFRAHKPAVVGTMFGLEANRFPYTQTSSLYLSHQQVCLMSSVLIHINSCRHKNGASMSSN